MLSVGEQVAEGLRLHRSLDAQAAAAQVVKLLDRVGIATAAKRMKAYAHELSGGQRQRVMIARRWFSSRRTCLWCAVSATTWR